ncbi:unnamed protein product [Linum trigynum]|uniref:DUF4283 domain-containing protein n=1 Tax=Linum trigynum TaxID=586398 RepID=A0AAV2DW69_9ROSI
MEAAPLDPPLALTKAWNLRHTFHMTNKENQLYGFLFLDQQDRDKVLRGGPWHYDNNLLIFKKGDAFHKPRMEDFNIMEIWVRIFGLPDALKTTEMAHKIDENFGSLIWVDSRVDTRTKDFLRLCVGKDIRTPLRQKLKLKVQGEVMKYPVKYEILCSAFLVV